MGVHSLASPALRPGAQWITDEAPTDLSTPTNKYGCLDCEAAENKTGSPRRAEVGICAAVYAGASALRFPPGADPRRRYVGSFGCARIKRQDGMSFRRTFAGRIRLGLGLLELIRNGFVSVPPGIPVYYPLGADAKAGGLPIYGCYRGTNRTENIHTHLLSRLPTSGSGIRHLLACIQLVVKSAARPALLISSIA